MTLAQYVIVGTVLIVGAIDIVIAVCLGRDATISVALTNWSKDYPAIPFAFGLLMGHFFLTYGVC
jgi:hypothetical protein